MVDELIDELLREAYEENSTTKRKVIRQIADRLGSLMTQAAENEQWESKCGRFEGSTF